MANQIHKLSIYRFRKLIGLAGIILPIVLPLGYVLGHGWVFKTALSDYYYSYMNVGFVGTLILCGIFLIYYGGYEPEPDEKVSDNSWTNIMGVLIILTAVFPTTFVSQHCDLCAPICNRSSFFGAVHLVSAFGFFILCGWMCVEKFTRGNLDHPGKASRNRLYRLCGIGIWVVCGVLAVCYLLDSWMGVAIWEYYIIIGEVVLLLLFATAWNVKGKALEDLRNLIK